MRSFLSACPRAVVGFLALAFMRSAHSGAPDTSCQAPEWDMGREVSAFGTTAEAAATAHARVKPPTLRLGRLYALTLFPQNEVEFIQPPAQGHGSARLFGGVVRFPVATSGSYRVTVDAPLWIDVATVGGIIAPSGFIGWHECPLYRKSVEYDLRAGQLLMLQLSGAPTAVTQITIEPPRIQ